MSLFQLHSKYKPTGDQPEAIKTLVQSLKDGNDFQSLLGVTGSGKTFTMANIIAEMNQPALIIAHNKTLAAQLAQEFKEFFPNNAVHYFVSYYDYYQPEAYVVKTGAYIEKEATINEEIDRLRHAATESLLTRRDVIIVASVSCIYGIGEVSEYLSQVMRLELGKEYVLENVIRELVNMQFVRSTAEWKPWMFLLKGDILEIWPSSSEEIIRIEFFGDEIEKITKIEHLTNVVLENLSSTEIFPAKHFVTEKWIIESVLPKIKEEMERQVEFFQKNEKLVEAERIKMRTEYDMEMLAETGYVNGIENYSMYLGNRKPWDAPSTLIEFFRYLNNQNNNIPLSRENIKWEEKKENKAILDKNWTPEKSSLNTLTQSDTQGKFENYQKQENIKIHRASWFLTFIDESHITIPQIGGMYAGDRARKENLVNFGFRLPSALENRPLKFHEFEEKIGQTIFVSATPSKYEAEHQKVVAEQVIRPTGLLDPEIFIEDMEYMVDSLMWHISDAISRGERALITTITKKSSEDLALYLAENGIKVRYLHSEIETIERLEILRDYRLGEIDVIVGVNLLREGLDLPETSFIGILDAEKIGFLRSKTSLLQIIGRAARNANGKVVMYVHQKPEWKIVKNPENPDTNKKNSEIKCLDLAETNNLTVSIAMYDAIFETYRRRAIQHAYNVKNNITPHTVISSIKEISIPNKKTEMFDSGNHIKENLNVYIKRLELEMDVASANLDFEKAAEIRDELLRIKKQKREKTKK